MHVQGPPRAIYTFVPLGLQFLARTLLLWKLHCTRSYSSSYSSHPFLHDPGQIATGCVSGVCVCVRVCVCAVKYLSSMYVQCQSCDPISPNLQPPQSARSSISFEIGSRNSQGSRSVGESTVCTCITCTVFTRC